MFIIITFILFIDFRSSFEVIEKKLENIFNLLQNLAFHRFTMKEMKRSIL